MYLRPKVCLLTSNASQGTHAPTRGGVSASRGRHWYLPITASLESLKVFTKRLPQAAGWAKKEVISHTGPVATILIGKHLLVPFRSNGRIFRRVPYSQTVHVTAMANSVQTHA